MTFPFLGVVIFTCSALALFIAIGRWLHGKASGAEAVLMTMLGVGGLLMAGGAHAYGPVDSTVSTALSLGGGLVMLIAAIVFLQRRRQQRSD